MINTFEKKILPIENSTFGLSFHLSILMSSDSMMEMCICRNELTFLSKS